jgi:hypothetical protein
MKMSRHFEEDVLVQRPYLTKEMCEAIVTNPLRIEHQDDGRTKYWGFVEHLKKYVRVVVLDDGETLHTAFPDRNFQP